MSERRDGMKHVPFMDADPDRVVVAMLEFKGKMYVATQKGIYILKDDKLQHVEMVEYKGDEPEDKENENE